MTRLAFTLLACGSLATLLRLIWLQVEIRNLHRAMDLLDRRYLAQFTGDAQKAERRLVNILRRSRGVPPL